MGILTQKKTTDYEDNITRVMEKTGLKRTIVEGVLGDLVRQKACKESQIDIANRWGLAFGNISTIRNMSMVTIEEIRAGLVSKCATIANEALDLTMDKLNDPNHRSEMKAKEAAQIAKQMTDAALNLSNNQVGAGNVSITAIGDVKMLIDLQSQRGERKSAIDRLKEKGVADKYIEAEVTSDSEEVVIEPIKENDPTTS